MFCNKWNILMAKQKMKMIVTINKSLWNSMIKYQLFKVITTHTHTNKDNWDIRQYD